MISIYTILQYIVELKQTIFLIYVNKKWDNRTFVLVNKWNFSNLLSKDIDIKDLSYFWSPSPAITKYRKTTTSLVILRHLFLSFGCESKRVFLLKQIWKKARLWYWKTFWNCYRCDIHIMWTSLLWKRSRTFLNAQIVWLYSILFKPAEILAVI